MTETWDMVNKAFLKYYRTNREIMSFSERLLVNDIQSFVLNYIAFREEDDIE